MRVLLAAACLASVGALAYPIPPQTLWDLTRDSELVVLARVAGVADNPHPADEVGSANARLEVIEVWKGKAPERLLVEFEPNFVCPAPPKFLAGRRVVAFLSREKGRWFVEGLSYGTRYPADEAEEAELKRAVTGALKARASDGPTVAWALAAGKARSTRWDGLYALSSASDPPHRFYDRRRKAEPALTEATLSELEQIMITAPSYDSTLRQLLAILAQRPNAAVTSAAADAIESVMTGSVAPYWMDEVMDLVEERLGKAPAPTSLPSDPIEAEVKLAKAPWEEPPQEREGRLQKRWDALKKAHRLTPKVRGDWSPTRWVGVGGETPL